MKKSLKKLVALAVLLISGTSCIFADVSDYVNKMYAKVDIGYRGGTPNVLTSYYDYFTICPTFGFCPVSDFQNLVAEISLDMNFSQPKSGPVQKVTDIIPAVKALYFFNPRSQLSYYAGGGLDIVFQTIKTDEKRSNCNLSIELLAGCKYKIDSSWSANAEVFGTFPSYDTWGIRAGAAYRF